MRNEPRVPVHVTPPPPEETHIHHEEEPTILGRWVKQGMEQGPVFWGAIALGVGGLVGLLWLINSWSAPSGKDLQAWSELAVVSPQDQMAALFGETTSSNAPERLTEIATTYPDTLAAGWAKVQAASILLREASTALPTTRREEGIGKLLEADTLFGEVAGSAKDPVLKRVAAFGAARAAEARLSLPLEDAKRPKPAEVVAGYEAVAKQFPETPEAAESARLAARLGDPINIEFYEELSKFNPADNSISVPTPGGGMGTGGLLSPGQPSPIEDLLRRSGGLPGGPSGGDFLPPAITPPGAEMPAPSEAAPATDPTTTPAPTEAAPATDPTTTPAPTEAAPMPEAPASQPTEPAPMPDPATQPPAEPTPMPEAPDPAPAPAGEAPKPPVEELPKDPFPTPGR